MKDRIATIMRDWLSTEFKNANAIPKPMLDGLAEEIDKHRWEIYRYTQEEYELEDIDVICENEGYELTKDEKDTVLHRYHNSEYQDMETLSYLVRMVVGEREQKDDSEEREQSGGGTQ